MFGAGYATTPAYEADLFGQKYCGAIHGRMLTASAAASIFGPYALSWMRNSAEYKAIMDLVSRIDPSIFAQKFGAPLSELTPLIEAKTVTINKLMQIAPPGTVDPTHFLYNTPFYVFAGVLVIGAVANFTIKPVDVKYYEDQPTIVSELSNKFTIAVCVNGTEYADAAFQYALKVLNKEKARLLILGVETPHTVALDTAQWPDLPTDHHIKKRQLLYHYSNIAKKFGLDHSTIICIGPNIGEAICFTAGFQKADLILMGSSKKKGISTMLGTISKYVADHSSCNIMFVKNKENVEGAPFSSDFNGENAGEWKRIHRQSSESTHGSLIEIFELK